MLFAGRWQPSALAGRGWAPLLLTVGAAGGLARVFDETGMAELLAEHALHPRYGMLTPFLAAAIVKTMQGNSLTAVLTASGMVEPMLPALGLDSATGRALAAAAVGAGSMAICHVNDPFFWIAAPWRELSPGRALYVISLGSVVMAVGALVVLAALRQFIYSAQLASTVWRDRPCSAQRAATSMSPSSARSAAPVAAASASTCRRTSIVAHLTAWPCHIAAATTKVATGVAATTRPQSALIERLPGSFAMRGSTIDQVRHDMRSRPHRH